MSYDKESVYDEEIAPLMKQILEICKREKIPMAVQYYLKEFREDAGFEGLPMYCTSVIVFEGKTDGDDQIRFVNESMKYGRQGKPWVMAATITTR
jgi:hypothetical protein